MRISKEQARKQTRICPPELRRWAGSVYATTPVGVIRYEPKTNKIENL
jgi:hypothetical protein